MKAKINKYRWIFQTASSIPKLSKDCTMASR